MIITEEQRRYYSREYEDFAFKQYSLDLEVSLDGPLPHYADEEAKFPNLIVQVTKVFIDGQDEPVATGTEADRVLTDAEYKELVQEVNDRLADEAAAWAERQAER